MCGILSLEGMVTVHDSSAATITIGKPVIFTKPSGKVNELTKTIVQRNAMEASTPATLYSDE